MGNNQETFKGINTILETDSLSSILSYLQSNTLVASDLDNTLIEPFQQLGSSQWDDHVKEKMRQSGKTEEEVEDLSFDCWHYVQSLTNVHCVDPSTPDVIQRIQEQEADFIVLTARRPAEIAVTLQQIESVGIRLNKDFFSGSNGRMEGDSLSVPAHYQEGILLSTALNKKSDVLRAFFKKAGYCPNRLIFLDDKWDHIHDMQELAISMGIEYVGIRFSGSDRRVKAFDPQVTDVQYQALPVLLSDKEAKLKLNAIQLHKMAGLVQP